MTNTLIQRLRDYGCCNIRKDAAVSRAQPAAPDAVTERILDRIRNTLIVEDEPAKTLRHAIELRVRDLLMEIYPEAPPAAPAAYLTDCPTSESAIDAERTKAREDMCLYGIGFTVNGWHVPAPLVSIYKLPDAAPSVAPEPVAWEGGEGWESLAWELCADENGEDACNELIWEGGPIPDPWGDRWMKYEGEAKRLIALVHKHAAHPPRAPLTDDEVDLLWRKAYADHCGTTMSFDWFEAGVRALEQAHQIGGK